MGEVTKYWSGRAAEMEWGKRLIASGRGLEAAARLENVLEYFPDDVQVLNNLGVAYERLGLRVIHHTQAPRGARHRQLATPRFEAEGSSAVGWNPRQVVLLLASIPSLTLGLP